MQLSGLRYGSKLLQLVEFPVADFIDGSATNQEIQQFLEKHKKLVVKPAFYGGVGKKGKAGLVRVVGTLQEALQAKRDLFFAQHTYGNKVVTANGVTMEAFVPSDLEVYFSISSSSIHRGPVFTITPWGGVDIEDLPAEKKAVVEIDPFIGINAFEITNALTDTGCPEAFISALVQHLPKLWELYDGYGLTTIELNPIRVQRRGNQILPVACDVKASFDQDNPAWKRIGLPDVLFQTETTSFEADINELRTYQGQSDVLEMNPKGSILPFMFGGGANSAGTESLGDAAIFSSDFGGNPPYEKIYEISRIVFEHWYQQADMLLLIGGKANNTDIYVTFKGVFDALRDHVAKAGWKPLYVVIGRGGPNVVKGMFYAKDILDRLRMPYQMFGHDTSMILTLEHARKIDRWWRAEGADAYRKQIEIQARS